MRHALAFLLVLSLAPTASATSSPRRTTRGYEERWQRQSVDIILDKSLEDLAPNAKRSIRRGLAVWSDIEPGLPKPSFFVEEERGSEREDGVIRVLAMQVDDPKFRNVLAYTKSYAKSDSGTIIEADIVFNTRFNFTTDDKHANCTLYDLESVAAHEMGHFLGLGEDPEEGSTMYVLTPPCSIEKRHPVRRDLESVVALYDQPGGSETDTTATGQPLNCSFGIGGRTAPYPAVAGVVAALVFVRRRRSARRPSSR